jgi:hypothetical protein
VRCTAFTESEALNWGSFSYSIAWPQHLGGFHETGALFPILGLFFLHWGSFSYTAAAPWRPLPGPRPRRATVPVRLPGAAAAGGLTPLAAAAAPRSPRRWDRLPSCSVYPDAATRREATGRQAGRQTAAARQATPPPPPPPRALRQQNPRRASFPGITPMAKISFAFRVANSEKQSPWTAFFGAHQNQPL